MSTSAAGVRDLADPPPRHAPDPLHCPGCADLTADRDLRRLAAVEHRLGYSVLEPRPVELAEAIPTRWRTVA